MSAGLGSNHTALTTQQQADARAALGLSPVSGDGNLGLIAIEAASAVGRRVAAAHKAAGGTQDARQLDAVATWVSWLSTRSVWAAIAELWAPMGLDGEHARALVKLVPGRTATGSYDWALTNTNFVTGDYTVLRGMSGLGNGTTYAGAASKHLDSSVHLASQGIASNAYGVSVYCTRPHSRGVLAGTSADEQVMVSYATTNYSQAGTTSPGVLRHFPSQTLMTVQRTAAGRQQSWIGGLMAEESTAGTVTDLDRTWQLFTCKGSTGSYPGDGDIGGYAIYRRVVTSAELLDVMAFFDGLSESIGRNVWGAWSADGATLTVLPTGIAGDSIVTTATNSSANVLAANNWMSLLSTRLGMSRHPYQDTNPNGFAFGGRGMVAGTDANVSLLSQTAPGNTSGHMWTVCNRRAVEGGLCLAVNDLIQGASPEAFDASYRATLDRWLRAGTLVKSRFRLFTPPVNPTAGYSYNGGNLTMAKALVYRAKIMQIGADYGLRVVDFTGDARMLATAATDWDYDGFGVHPETSVHAIMAKIAGESY